MSVAATNPRISEEPLSRGSGVPWLAAWMARAPDWLLRDVLLPFIATRAALMAIAWVADAAIIQRVAYKPSENSWFVNSFARSDSQWYLSIAQNGYGVGPEGFPTYVFSPLYPAIMKAIGFVLHQESTDRLLLIGIGVANVATLLGVAYLVRLVRLDFDAGTAARAALYLLVFPTTMYLSAVYPESLFILLAVASLYYARKGNWWLAGVMGGLAALSRPQGVLIAAPLVWEFVAQRRERGLSLFGPSVLFLLLVPGAYLGLAGYMYRVTGNPLTMLTAEAGDAWSRHLAVPFSSIFNGQILDGRFLQHINSHPQVDALSTIVFGVLVVLSWRLLRQSYAVFAVLLYLPVILTDNILSLVRYCMVIFPAFIVLAIAGRHPTFDRLYVVGSAVIAGLFMALFATGYWVA